jgi:hypothetical protein
METKKVSRKSIEKEISKKLKLRLDSFGWSILKSDTNYFFKKYNEKTGWGFTFSLYNSGPYSCFFKGYIIYIKFTTIIKELLKDTPESDFLQVGLVSSKIPRNTRILSISTLEEVPNFVNEIISMLDKVEQEYWLHYSNIENTINEFKQNNHVFWPVSDLSQFVAHMIAYSIENNRKDIIKIVVEKAKQLLETGNYERDRNFVNTVINVLNNK